MLDFDPMEFMAPLTGWAPLMAVVIGAGLGVLLWLADRRLTRVHFVWSLGGAFAFFLPLSLLRALEGSTVWERFAATTVLWVLFEAGMAAGQWDAAAVGGLRGVRRDRDAGPLHVLARPPSPLDGEVQRVTRVEVYQDRAGHWRWRMRAPNGRRVAASGERFASRYNAERAVADLLLGLAPLVDAERERLRSDVPEAVAV